MTATFSLSLSYTGPGGVAAAPTPLTVQAAENAVSQSRQVVLDGASASADVTIPVAAVDEITAALIKNSTDQDMTLKIGSAAICDLPTGSVAVFAGSINTIEPTTALGLATTTTAVADGYVDCINVGNTET